MGGGCLVVVAAQTQRRRRFGSAGGGRRSERERARAQSSHLVQRLQAPKLDLLVLRDREALRAELPSFWRRLELVEVGRGLLLWGQKG